MLVDAIIGSGPMSLLLLLGLAVGVAGVKGYRSTAGALGCASLLIAEAVRLNWIWLFHHYTADQPTWFDWLRPATNWTTSILALVGTALLLAAIYQNRDVAEPSSAE